MKNKLFSVRDMVMCALFTALLAAGAFIKIPMPLVPMTLQAQFALLAGVLLGARGGAISVALYLLLGLCGLPVFTGGGGIGYVLRPTFGYIIGFLIGAVVAGLIARRCPAPSFWRILAAQLAGLGILYFIGVVYFYVICNYAIAQPVSVGTVLVSGFLLTLPNDLVLCAVGSLGAKRLMPVLQRGS